MFKLKSIYRSHLIILGIIVIMFVQINCASIIHGTTQDIAVNSNPDGVKVIVKGVHMATTPAVIELKRKESTILRFEKEGYNSVEVILKRTTDGWVWGNILLGGIIGFIVDFSNGAAYKLSPEDINVELRKLNLSYKDLPKDGIVIAIDIQSIKK